MKRKNIAAISFISTILTIFQLHAAGDFKVDIVNNIQDSNTKTYILVKGINPNTNKLAFLKFDNPAAVATYVDVTQPDADINNPTQCLDYGYEYTHFKQADGKYRMRLPHLLSGRIYVCLNNKIRIPVVGQAPNVGFADPSAFNPNDPSYNYLYDKMEFTYLTNGATWINPTAVDCLGLPLAIEQARDDGSKPVYGVTVSRQEMFERIEAELNKPGIDPEWKRLMIRDSAGTILRVVAPGREAAYFDPNYLNDYINRLWEHYKTHTLTVNCEELGGQISPTSGIQEAGLYKGQVKGDVFEFKRMSDGYTVLLDVPSFTPPEQCSRDQKKPTSNQFFMADQCIFAAPNGSAKAVIVREITASWSVGLLPVADSVTLGSQDGKRFYEEQKRLGNFYTDNKIMPPPATGKIPWYTLYGKAIHDVNEHIYAFAYDDAIGLDGTNASNDKHPGILTIGALRKNGASTPAPAPTPADTPNVPNPQDPTKEVKKFKKRFSRW